VQVKDPVSFTTAWLTAHIANAQSLGKPFIVEEFGKSINARDPTTISTVRDPVFTAVYNMLNSNLKADGIFKGMLNSSSESLGPGCLVCLTLVELLCHRNDFPMLCVACIHLVVRFLLAFAYTWLPIGKSNCGSNTFVKQW